MNSRIDKSALCRRVARGRAAAFVVGVFAAFSSMSATSVEIAQSPLYIGSDVPGNLALVPSVEFPTLISVANFGAYDPDRVYVGYFDAAKCYEYRFNAMEELRHFYPVAWTNNRRCVMDSNQWSGNYLNWAGTQTIDPFRLALTGGYRVRDTATETWVEKAISDRDGNNNANANFPRRTVPATGDDNPLISSLTPVASGTWASIRTRIDGRGNKMRFSTGALEARLSENNPAVSGLSIVVPYNPADHRLNGDQFPLLHPLRGVARRDEVVYELSMRVAVCVPGFLEAHCKQYGSNWKPEGLIQEYSEKIRFSIFGYLNNGGSTEPDGGVMRARQKFVGPNTHYPELGVLANAGREWDPDTGIQYQNPDAADATSTNASIVDSGVINYLNKFGQMNTGRVAKSYDNVSELYYAANRYFRNLGNVPSYSTLSGNRRQLADGFPVISTWDDPVRYACQTNVILGIGDTNTWRDKNLPGNTSSDGESNAKAPEVVADATVNVVEDLYRIWRMEGASHSVATTRSTAAAFNNSAHNNSSYIAALAYAANTRDIRSDLDGKQTISTYWVDVVENRDYKSPASNQYWLATKYGGFRVPLGFDPDNNNPAALAVDTWHRTADMVPATTPYARPDNFYVAADAAKMVASLRQAFENILDEMQGSASSFASNTTKLEVGARTYQAQFVTGRNNEWGGELGAFDVNIATGALTSAWSATTLFPVWGPLNSTPNARQIYYKNGTTLAPFQGAVAGMTSDVVDYLRGDRSREQSNGGPFRNRRSVLGDIVNSQPTFVGAPNSRLHVGQTFSGASSYPAFAAAQASRTPVIYVGANDGMLHAFNAATGRELFAFVPTETMPKLYGANNFTDPNYEHKYTVDGAITAADWFNGSSWRTVVVGTMGRGGKSVFALDVTNPASPTLLWEVGNAAFGNNLGQPIVAQVADGDWRVLFGNGPNSTDGVARLITIRLSSGNVASVTTGVGADNGLSGINAWSSAGNGIVDTVYAGDLKGNLWRFNPTGGTPIVLYAAGATKPITATPVVAKNPRTLQTWVFVGTGRYLNSADVSTTNVQTWYGLIDRGTTIAGGLNSVSILAEGQVGGRDVRVVERLTAPGVNGWYMDLLPPSGSPQGERMVVPNFFQGLTLIGTTRIPDSDDVCSPSGKGFTMAIDPFTGGRLSGGFFDVNGDGTVDAGDSLNGTPVSGIGYNSSPNNPIFLGDMMYTSLDDGTSAVTRTNASGSNLRRVSWRELIRD